jgi:hypothetical protein
MTDGEDADAEAVAVLAKLLGVAVRKEHLQEVARYWRLMAPHRALVAGVRLAPEAEPAALFRP